MAGHGTQILPSTSASSRPSPVPPPDWRRCTALKWRVCTPTALLGPGDQSCSTVIQVGGRRGRGLPSLIHRATAYRMEGSDRSCHQDYDQADRARPQVRHSLNDRGTAYSQKAQPNRAIQNFDRRFASTRKWPRPNNRAMPTPLKVISSGPFKTMTGLRLQPLCLRSQQPGNAYRGLGELDRRFGTSTRRPPRAALVLALNNRGSAYSSKGELDRAIKD